MADSLKTDVLIKPDMRAVLSRTHLAHDLHGFLLPVLEAISNAMDGIHARFDQDDEKAAREGEVKIRIKDPNEPSKILVSVTDNGVGLTDDNYSNFRTPFTGHKLKEKGRGFGRFIAFKVFARILYSSRSEFFAAETIRCFRFDINQDREFQFNDGSPDFEGPGMCVEYNQPLAEWHDLIRGMKPSEALDEIGAHFLPYFLYRWLPKITIQWGEGAAEDITSHFRNVFVEYDHGTFECSIDGVLETLNYSLARIPRSSRFKSHCLLFSAADRIVGSPRDLSTKLGVPSFVDENDARYIVIAIVRGDAFERRLNDARTSIDLAPKVVEDIVSKVSDVVQRKESVQIDKIKTEQSTQLNVALRENPILRLGLRGKTLKEYVAVKPNHWKAEEFISDLAIERYRATNDLTKQIVAAANNRDDYEKTIKDLVGRLDKEKKEALAEYVIHRKRILELVESARKYGVDEKRAPEDTIHDLVFRRFRDGANTGYFEHNLWLIDDALAFLPYVSSDRAMHGRGRKSGDKVADLIFYDDSLILGDADGSTITIVEFKRPSRNDYAFGDIKSDPVLQVIETLEKATAAGGISRTDGSHVSFTSVVRRFAFIVADIMPTFVQVLRKHDFRNDWNPKIWVRYRDNEEILIQAFGYETLVDLAKKRNQAFFSVLLDE
ncbi:ATP-binding protein [Rhodopseudomonas sp. P1]|uniref:ATP-binding protein n=1 Tax=Rhodopseudomonas sp. P1 TaxID=3434357 RepID=UPI0031FD2F8C